jgi:hypothetical protein
MFCKVDGIRIICGGDGTGGVSSLALSASKGWLKRDILEDVKKFPPLPNSISATVQ